MEPKKMQKIKYTHSVIVNKELPGWLFLCYSDAKKFMAMQKGYGNSCELVDLEKKMKAELK